MAMANDDTPELQYLFNFQTMNINYEFFNNLVNFSLNNNVSPVFPFKYKIIINYILYLVLYFVEF